MNLIARSCKVAAVGVFALLALTACLVPGYGYGGDGVGVGYVGGVYEPGGYEYGGWAPGYRVGPPRGGAFGEHGRFGDHSRVGDHGGRAVGARAAPSIPRGARGGGGHRR